MGLRSDPCDPLAEAAAQARMRMVDRLKQEGAITSPVVEAAFRTIPRHLFLETFYLREQTAPVRWKQVKPSALDTWEWCQLVYADAPRITRLNEIGNPISSSSAPTIMAIMLEEAGISSGQRVLEIGAGTGYNAALLAFLVGDPAFVTTIELEDDLATGARRRLEQVIGLGVHVITGDGFAGYPPNAPYDRIVATASTHRIPLAWLDQLGEAGILVMHLQGHLAGGCLMRFQKQGPGRSGCGQMITGTDFTELRTPAVPSPLAPQLLTHLLHQDIACTVRFPQDQFDPTLLWDHHLAFLLQTLFPTLHLTSIRRQRGESPQICLLDEQTHTLLAFARAEEQQWNLEVRGYMQVWERVLIAYQQWVAVGRPAATAYQLHVDADGTQRLTLPFPSSPDGSFPSWVIYDPKE
jgi:protein-L-isoaspartate(D-aspartate) O-methyltransferase